MEIDYDYTYIGFICTDDDNKHVLITKSELQFNFSGIEGNDSLKNAKLEESEAMMVAVKYFDGTESVKLEYAHRVNYEDIIFVIENHGIIVNDYEESVYNMVYKDYDGLNFFWGLLEEFYETDEGMDGFEKFVKKDNWNNK